MKLLIADDCNVSRLMLLNIAQRWGYDVIMAEDGLQAWNIMQQDDAPKLLLLDWEMPNMSGIEVCEKVQFQFSQTPPYIILLTSRTSAEDVVIGLNKGANDYLSKPFNSPELQVRLKVGKRMIEMQDKLNNTLQELKTLASHDVLTGLLNRRAIMEGIGIEIKRAERLNDMLCMSMCDIDDFKKINDSYGHIVGDYVLKEVSLRMKNALRDHDLISRYGGEEFFIVTPVNAGRCAREVNERLCDVIAREPFVYGSLSMPVTISIGVSCYVPDIDSIDILDVIARADEALYQAKSDGRNRVVVDEVCNKYLSR